ncbi:head assembly [Podophage Lau218]|uniref:Phage capsid assembly protein n=1 Tax=Podophage Lau218 TaxID=2784187 RepID=A0A060BK72_9CAUD|nr:head assembly [Podophage Lau218]AIA83151.1 phage capsid assembly protein [Podophage Lau218]
MEEDNQNQAPQGELNQHEQEMLEVVEKNENQVAESLKSDEEKLLAGKYKSVEDLEKAYGELQTKLGSKDNEDAPKKEDNLDNDKTPELSKNDAKSEVESVGLDFDALYDEFSKSENGLSDDTYSKLEKAGINKNTVDNYIKGQEAIVQQTAEGLKGLVGGEDNYNSMIEWATTNLSESEQRAFDSVLGDEGTATFAIQGLYARFKATNPTLRQGSGVGSSSRGGFGTKSDMMEAMQSPKYKLDSTYRADVQRKIAMTDFL